jgi:hypothetical protein
MATLTGLTSKMKSESTPDYEFKHFQKNLPSQRTTVDGAQTDVETTIEVAAGTANIFKAGHIILNERTLETMWCDVDPASPYNSVSVVRARGSAGAVMNNLDGLLIIGSTYGENDVIPTAISYLPDTVYNFTEEFRTSLAITRRARKMRIRHGNTMKELKRECLQIHGMEMEKALFFGSRFEVVATNYSTTTTGGLRYWVSTNVTDFLGAVTMDDWEDFLQDAFAYGSKEKICYCGAQAAGILNRLARLHGHINLEPRADVYGLQVTTWVTPFGILKIVTHPLLTENATFTSWGFVVDAKNLTYMYFADDDTNWYPDLVQKDGRARDYRFTDRSEYMTDAGLRLAHEKHFAIFKNLSAVAA